MSAAHTPGPWRFRNPIGDNPDPIRGPYFEISGGGGSSFVKSFNVSGYVSEADARLMASAPDLLAACKNAWGCLGPDHPAFWHLLDAIKRATMEQL
jgi:hypothetical protein